VRLGSGWQNGGMKRLPFMIDEAGPCKHGKEPKECEVPDCYNHVGYREKDGPMDDRSQYDQSVKITICLKCGGPLRTEFIRPWCPVCDA